MNLNLIRPKNETEDLFLSITKNFGTLFEQTHRKAEKTLEFKMTQSKQMFDFEPAIPIEGSWMIGLTDLEAYKSILNINHTNTKFEHYTDTADEFSFEELKDELEEILDNSNSTDNHIEDGILGPRINQSYWKLRSEQSSTDVYINLILGYARFLFEILKVILEL